MGTPYTAYETVVSPNETRLRNATYGLRLLADGRWEEFNREYESRGVYHTFTPEKLTEVKAVALNVSETELFFYNDGCTPWTSDVNEQDYVKRVSVLDVAPSN